MANNLFNTFSSTLKLNQQPTAQSTFAGLLKKKGAESSPSTPLGAQTGLTTTPAQSPTTGQGGADLAKLQASLGSLRGQAEGIQSGLAGLQQQQTDVKSIGERLRPFAQRVTGLFGASPEEEGVRSKLANLMSAREKGLVQAEEQAVPLQAILGEQGRIERRALAGAIPLQEQLSQLISRREGERQAAQFEFGAEKDIFGLEKQEEERQRPDETKVTEFTNEAGEKVVVFRDNKTGKVRQETLGKEQSTRVETAGTERVRAAEASAISRARPLLIAARTGGNLEETYLKLRSDYAEAIGDPSTFDKVFSPFLDEKTRVKLFGKAGTIDQGGGGTPFD